MSSIALKKKEKRKIFQNRQAHNAGEKVHIVVSDIGSLKAPGVASVRGLCFQNVLHYSQSLHVKDGSTQHTEELST